MGESIHIERLKEYFSEGNTTTYLKDHIICDIHKKVKTFRWLIEGSVDYYIAVENPDNDLLVCTISEPYTTLGLNGFNQRKRYTYKAVIASPKAIFYEIPLKTLKDFIREDTQNLLLKSIGVKLYRQLRTALLKQTELLNPVRFQPFVEDREFYITPNSEQSEIVSLMRRSPFLDFFEEKYLKAMADIAERREYEPDEVLYVQDGSSNGLFILIHGEVAIKRVENNIEIRQRSIKNSGFIFGWSSLLEEKDICSAITTQKTSAYFIPQRDLIRLFVRDKAFETLFYEKLLWLMGNQMNAAFVRYVGLLGKHNLQAVYQLINNNKSRIKLASPLHQVPHLLANINTKPFAYSALTNILNNGTALERHLASLSLELLSEDKKELAFINGLRNIYEVVAERENVDSEKSRKACAEVTSKVFDKVPHVIEGWENLPDNPGNIFIYNHLVNDTYYTLNNNFQITLDSHFLSAMVLYRKYGEPGIRTVRIGKGQEYGHQNYYDRLGYINVYTKESEETTAEEKKASRSIFYSKASKYLENNYNLIISPEGTSYRTEESPGPFKLGSFKLAMNSFPEPYIVPVVMVNFDHRIGKSLYYCSIKKPFKLSDKVPSRKMGDLVDFVNEYQLQYKKDVKQAIDRAENLFMAPTKSEGQEPPEIWRNEIKRLKRRIAQLSSQENLIAFYGSSSIRLWVNMQRDLAPMNVVNLGFGGSSFAWCIHYFEEVFKDANPYKIVLYAGENDLSEGKTPQEVLADCKELVQLIYNKYPGIELALISLKPSVEREALIPLIMETNLLLSKYIISELNAQYINVFGQMITTENRPIPELYMSDGLHLNKSGYALWSNAIKKALLATDNLETEQ
ncbi:cyclic nucleotide-binding domain-containing protein [Maribacter sp. MMG018]|uniref:cyclic nucleotide-binding domain-containing protein n=1 Tax=Maribacter sp. MMG018 TaxID=2822688 RepID=UPI001B382B4C|nr:cyclic nucleotide-binding domain-containing protein [Maribacter sp. MMG018]MBQ4913709.1 cyclic nucleotide-binding domain-containing protein [Maribacter sp. MMG018]